MTPEQLIADLQKQIAKLEEELLEAKEDIKDFERLAATWKKGHDDLLQKYKRDTGNYEDVIEDLQNDLRRMKNNADWD